MKTIKQLFVIALVGLAMQSCNLSDLATVTVPDVTVTKSIDMNVTGSSSAQGVMKITATSKTFSKSDTLKLSSVPEIANQLSKIKSLTIKQGFVWASGMNPAETTVSNLTISFPDLNISKVNSYPTDQAAVLEFTAAELTSISNEITTKKQIRYSVSGTVSNYPVTFVVGSSFTADVKVGLLN